MLRPQTVSDWHKLSILSTKFKSSKGYCDTINNNNKTVVDDNNNDKNNKGNTTTNENNTNNKMERSIIFMQANELLIFKFNNKQI